MKVIHTDIKDLLLFEPRIFEDERGSFFESFHQEQFEAAAGQHIFVQDNQSVSRAGVVRGLHYQEPPHAQGKLVRVVKGAVLDVAVDIRKNSPTYGQHVAVELSESNRLQFWIPPGFAHGFAVLEEGTVFAYKCTAFYNKDSDRVLLWNDSALKIDWKINEPLLSEKDKSGVPFHRIQSAF